MSDQSYTEPPDELIGTVLAGRYRILQKLGEGAMGAVYLGEHLKMGRQDAIKVLRGALSGDREAIARFTRGARNVAAVQHPNVCTIYDYGDTQDGLPFLAMEFIRGESLKELLDEEGRLPLARALHITLQVAGALQAAHDAEIVHRDLKPANIMLMRARDDSDTVRVVDFDIAKGSRDGEESELTRLGFVVGTPEYMSPEQLMGERLDGRSDLYSLALVFFRMLTGTLPFRAESAQDLMIQRLTVKPLPLVEALPGTAFPAGLEEVLERALSRKAVDRHADAAEFARDLEAVCAGVAAPLPRPAPPPPAEIPATRISAASVAPPPAAPTAGSAPRTTSRRAAIFGGAALATVALAAVVGVLLMKSSPAQEATPTSPIPAAVTPGVTTLATNEEPAAPEEQGQAVDPDATSEGISAQLRRPVDTQPERPAPRTAEPPRSGSNAISISPAGATDLLWRQLDLLGPPYPSRAVLTAVRDSATAVWELGGASTQDRAFSAYVLGSTWFALGSASECTTWIQRALKLRPDGPGYHTMLDNCRS